jgi:hypothetical protein
MSPTEEPESKRRDRLKIAAMIDPRNEGVGISLRYDAAQRRQQQRTTTKPSIFLYLQIHQTYAVSSDPTTIQKQLITLS